MKIISPNSHIQVHNPITRLVAILHRRTHMYFDRRLKPHGLNFTHFRMMMFLLRNDGARQEDIRAHIDMDKGAAAHALKRLTDLGFVAREQHPDDGRAYMIRLTDEGVAFLGEFDRVAQEWNAKVVENLTDDEKRIAEDLLQKMVDNTCELLGDDCKEPGECHKKHA